jgi:hypothetical protein
VVQWAKKAELEHLTMRLLFEGLATVTVCTKGGEPVFAPVETGDAVAKPETKAHRLLREHAQNILEELARQPGGKTAEASGRCHGERQRAGRTKMSGKLNNSSEPSPDEAALKFEKWFIPDAEFEALCRALSLGQDGFTTDEMGQVVQWVKSAKLRHCMLELIYASKVEISVSSDGELVFRAVEKEPNQKERETKLEARRLIRELDKSILKEIARQQGWKTRQTQQRIDANRERFAAMWRSL